MTLYLIKYTWMQVPFTIDSSAHYAVKGTYYNWFVEFICKYAREIEWVKKV